MVARFSECAMVSNWLPHTSVQILFCLILVHKIIGAHFPLQVYKLEFWQ